MRAADATDRRQAIDALARRKARLALPVLIAAAADAKPAVRAAAIRAVVAIAPDQGFSLLRQAVSDPGAVYNCGHSERCTKRI